MRLEEIQVMCEKFPGIIKLFGCQDDKKLIASAICVRISERILYVFYWGDLPGFSTSSPVVTLADAIYTYCQKNNISILDVGTSTLGTNPNYGLIQFKRGLGFNESLKLQMGKLL